MSRRFGAADQTATYFAVLRAVNHVACRAAGDRQNSAALCPGDITLLLTPEDRIYDAAEHPRIFEVGREGAVDLSVVDVEGVRTIHPFARGPRAYGQSGSAEAGHQSQQRNRDGAGRESGC